MKSGVIPMINFTSICITPNHSIVEALSVIEGGSAQIALVLNSSGVLVGTLSDGDIRRSLLSGIGLNETVEKAMNTNFVYATEQNDEAHIRSLMKQYVLRQIPVLSPSGHVLDLKLLEENDKNIELPNTVVIMAGGKGTRLRPYTENCPKPMILINGKPILETLIAQCAQAGFTNIVLSVNYLKEQIIQYFGDGSKFGVNISYLQEDKPLGTAGSLSLLPNLNHPLLVMNGDVLTKLNFKDLLDFHNQHNSSATLCVREHKIDIPFGVVEYHETSLTGFKEKPSLVFKVNAGIYVVSPDMLSYLPADQYVDIPTFFEIIQDEVTMFQSVRSMSIGLTLAGKKP